MFKYLALLLLLVLIACEAPISQEVLLDAPEAKLIVPEKIMSPEERDLENKIANRTLLQTVVDGSEKFEKTELAFECHNNSGGILTYIKDGEEIKGIRFAISENGWNEFVSLYYKGDELAFVAHEKGAWQGGEETDTQTVFYLDDNKVIRCMRKTASGSTEKIESLVMAAEFESIGSDSRLLQKIKNYEELFLHKVSSKNISEIFCQ